MAPSIPSRKGLRQAVTDWSRNPKAAEWGKLAVGIQPKFDEGDKQRVTTRAGASLTTGLLFLQAYWGTPPGLRAAAGFAMGLLSSQPMSSSKGEVAWEGASGLFRWVTGKIFETEDPNGHLLTRAMGPIGAARDFVAVAGAVADKSCPVSEVNLLAAHACASGHLRESPWGGPYALLVIAGRVAGHEIRKRAPNLIPAMHEARLPEAVAAR